MSHGQASRSKSLVLLILGFFAVVGLVVIPSHSYAHSRLVLVLYGIYPGSENPGQFQDEVDVEVRLTNYKLRPVRVRCKVEVVSSWFPDADDDGYWDTLSPYRYRGVKWFRTRVGAATGAKSRSKTKAVHVVVPHPNTGPESPLEFYGNDHFPGWEYEGMEPNVNHCHRAR